jgi:protein ImuA
VAGSQERAPSPGVAGLGVVGLDTALGGGLAHARLHEIYGAATGEETSAQGFALMLALLAGKRPGRGGAPIVWITERRSARTRTLYGPGIADLGVDPARLLIVTVADEAALLQTAADVARSSAAAALVVAPGIAPRRVDLTVSRRLTLFAERSGVTVLMLRGAGQAMPSAAETRWRVGALPSTPLEAGAPGRPTLSVDLIRRRGGPPSLGWRLEWDRERIAFDGLPGALPADAGVGRLAGGAG